MPPLVVRGALMAAVVLACAMPARAEAPFRFESAPGRLPKTVVPLDYRIAITPDVGAKTLAGREIVVLDVRRPVDTIVFNSLGERLHDVRLDGVAVATVRSSDPSQLTTLTLAKSAPVGRHTLTFAYDAQIESAPQGLFAQPYRLAGGSQGMMLSTQFEATDARRMFPCWDEPAFRATYELTVTVPAAWATVSNTPVRSRVVHGALATTTFARTPKMPSYLVEFSAGDLVRLHAKAANGVDHGVWAVNGQQQNGATALANSQQILADYDAYFGVPFPLPKLDHIAVPGGFAGAMENWGAITYNDQALLVPPDATVGRRQTVFSIMAHEMAHQWNGDLVTMGWWDDIWLNESFASWMAAKETALRNPSWKWQERQDATKERAMNADARVNVHPIQQHITDELQAEASFDSAITYNKGQVFLGMLEAYLGEDTFRDGIRRYIADRKYSNATSADLWAALSAASGKDVAKFAAGWTEQPGFPLVTVTAQCDAAGNRTIALTQKRFMLSGGATGNERWNVPMRIRAGTNPPHAVLLTKDGQTTAAGRCDETLSANDGDLGYYRVAYDPATFAVNVKGFETLSDPDKIVMLDDQWANVQAGGAEIGSYLALTSAMGTDRDTRAWQQILGALGAIERDERGTAGHAGFASYARALVRPIASEIGWDATPGEQPVVGDLRREILGNMGDWDDAPTVAEASRRFAAFAHDRSAIAPDDQETVLSIVAEHADRATFDQLHAIARDARNEAEVRRYYGALLSVRDPKLAEEALALLLTSEIPPQAAGIRAGLVANAAKANPQLAWRFYQAHSAELLSSRSVFERMLSLANVPETFWNAAPLGEIEAWVNGHEPPDARPYVARAMERARFQLALKERVVAAADAFVTKTGR